LTTAPETDILVGFSARALCPATLPLPGEAADLGFSVIAEDLPKGYNNFPVCLVSPL
jgi:hypothetical protein